MTDIREGLAEELDTQSGVSPQKYEEYVVKYGAMADAYCSADIALTYLHSQGVVRKVEGELTQPTGWVPYVADFTGGYNGAQQDMLKAGYTLTVPLEVKDESIHNPS